MAHHCRALAALSAALLGGSLCLAAPQAPAIEPAEKPPPSQLLTNRMALAGRLAEPPRIDGIIEPEAWTQATALAPMSLAGTADPAPVATEVRVGCTEEFLFIALTCEMPETEPMTGPATTQPARLVRAGDRVEILFDSVNDRLHFKGVVVGPGEGPAGFEILDGKRSPNAKIGLIAAVARTGNGWSAEVALPRKRLDDPANCVIGFNVIRRLPGADGAAEEMYAWNPASAQEIESGTSMGNLAFDTPPAGVQQVRLGQPRVGENSFQIRLRNDTPREQNVRVGLATRSAGREPDFSRYKTLLPASKTVELGLTHSIRDAGPHDFEFLLVDDATGRQIAWFARRNVPVDEKAVQPERKTPEGERQAEAQETKREEGE